MAILTTLNKDLEIRFKIKSPRIAITGLNPHAGEGGEFGKEEKNIISPVISTMIKKVLIWKVLYQQILLSPQIK